MSKHKTQEQHQEIDEEEEWLTRREEEKRRDQEERDANQREKYGVATYERRSEDAPSVTVIPVEIEVSWALDQFVKHEILDELGYSYRNWVQECYLHRMREILTDPAEFGKAVLEQKKHNHCIAIDDHDLRVDRRLIKMQKEKELEMDLRVRITESQYEAMKKVAEASGDTLDKWLHTCVIQGIESDIDLYYGKSKNISEMLFKKIGSRYGSEKE